jgi:cellulose synthase/poly-beta-1,6-N-acetylglucosamine synthase-like glycosyltransferase
LDWVVLAVVALSWISLPTLLLKGRSYSRRLDRYRRQRARAGIESHEDQFLWVFVVPALNEEVTIADSVARLQATSASHAVFLVVDDGSDDRTAEILAGIHDPRLEVLTRVSPHARTGKAAALNDAWAHLRKSVLQRPEHAGWDEDHVIVTIVDADGRLDENAPNVVSDHFIDPEIGGVQSLVRIYNRRGWLTWAQDVEFSTFGRVYQHGRSGWGSANMGGNGQFNRLSALTQVAGPDASGRHRAVSAPDAAVGAVAGPWRDKLTEDQDLGVRLIQAGWRGIQANDTWVDQQGVNSLRRLYRQRTRWAQGNWQAFALLPTAWREHLSLAARVDALYYLLSPALQLVTGIGFAASIVAFVVDLLTGEPIAFGAWWLVVIFLGLSFGPGIWALTVRESSWAAPLKALILVIPYSVYAWMIFPVLFGALVRQLMGRNSWAKTSRESLESIEAQVEEPTAV